MSQKDYNDLCRSRYDFYATTLYGTHFALMDGPRTLALDYAEFAQIHYAALRGPTDRFIRATTLPKPITVLVLSYIIDLEGTLHWCMWLLSLP